MSGERDAGSAARVRAARPEDTPRIYELMRGLARYERLEAEFTATVEGMREALFGPDPAVECLVLEDGAALSGYALFYPVFSSFRARRMMWLEDLYVDPGVRGGGGGRKLMRALARLCLERGVTRIGWIVLDWNEPAIGFYQYLGGAEQPSSEWLQYALGEDGVRRLAAEDG